MSDAGDSATTVTTGGRGPRENPPALDWSTIRLPGLNGDTVALVTGGAGSLGWRATEALAGLGARVGVMGRSAEAVRSVIDGAPEQIRQRLVPVPGDVSVQADAHAAVGTLVQRFGRLDVLVHCAAIGDTNTDIADLTVAEIDEMLAVNIKGTLLIAQAAAGPMRAAGRGSMILVASVGAFRVNPKGTVYGATKAAVVRTARQLAVDLGPDGVRVNALSPGQTPTLLRKVDEEPGTLSGSSRGGDAARIPLRRRGVLDDYAGVIAFLASDLSAYVTGVDLLVDGGVAVRR